MIYITGDSHGIQSKWFNEIEPILHQDDIIIVCGDFGVGFWKSSKLTEEEFYDYLSKQDYTVLFIDGNHEDFSKLYSYPVESLYQGQVHKIRHNVIHLMRGEVYQIEGYSIFTMGGAYSIDKPYRIEGKTWWKEEMPSDLEYEHAISNLEKVNYQVDYIISHTAPGDSVYYLSTMRHLHVRNDVFDEMPLTSFLDKIQRKTSYNYWYFGHFHKDIELWRNQIALFSSIRELTTGKIVHQWESYEERSITQ